LRKIACPERSDRFLVEWLLVFQHERHERVLWEGRETHRRRLLAVDYQHKTRVAINELRHERQLTAILDRIHEPSFFPVEQDAVMARIQSLTLELQEAQQALGVLNTMQANRNLDADKVFNVELEKIRAERRNLIEAQKALEMSLAMSFELVKDEMIDRNYTTKRQQLPGSGPGSASPKRQQGVGGSPSPTAGLLLKMLPPSPGGHGRGPSTTVEQHNFSSSPDEWLRGEARPSAAGRGVSVGADQSPVVQSLVDLAAEDSVPFQHAAAVGVTGDGSALDQEQEGRGYSSGRAQQYPGASAVFGRRNGGIVQPPSPDHFAATGRRAVVVPPAPLQRPTVDRAESNPA
jgi:hypothetical protein